MGQCKIGCWNLDPCPMGYECVNAGFLNDLCAWPD
jgi:hypothetical protein